MSINVDRIGPRHGPATIIPEVAMINVTIAGQCTFDGPVEFSEPFSFSTTDVAAETIGFFRPETYGAVGDGITDDTSAINACITAAGHNRILGQNKIYKTTALTDAQCAVFDTQMQIVNSSVLYNSYGMDLPVFNSETLYGWYAVEKDSTASKLIVWDGDSTTIGTGVDLMHDIPGDCLNMLKRDGFYNITMSNLAAGGRTTLQWAGTRGVADGTVQADISANANLYIIRYGLNDYAADMPTFADRLDVGLEKLRTAFPISGGVGIILMPPNAAHSTNVKEPWLEGVARIHQRMAVKWACAFVDTYGLLQNARPESAGYWMNADLLHPRSIYLQLLLGHLYNVIVPPFIRYGQQFIYRSSPQSFATPSSTCTLYISGRSLQPEFDLSGGAVTISNPANIRIQPALSLFGVNIQASFTISMDSKIDAGSKGAFSFRYTTEYSDKRTTNDQIIFSMGPVYNAFSLTHQKNTGKLLLNMTNSTSVAQPVIDLGTWVAPISTERLFELDWDLTAATNNIRLFINGVLQGAATQTFTRTNGYIIQFGTTSNEAFAVRDIRWYSMPQHSTNYSPAYDASMQIVSGDSSIMRASTITKQLVVENGVSIVPTNCTFYATWAKSADANYTIDPTVSKSQVGTGPDGVSSFSLDFGRVFLFSRYLRFAISTLIDTGNVVSFRFHFTPWFSTSASNGFFFAVGTYGTVTDRMQFYRNSTGHLILNIAAISIDFGVWSLVQRQTYEFLVNVNLTNGINQLFIDGVQMGLTDTTTGARTAHDLLVIGGQPSVVGISAGPPAGWFSDFVIYSAAPYISNYAPGYSLAEETGSVVFKPAVTFNTVPIYVNNAAAVAAGLTVGMLYRSGSDPDVVSIVH